MRVQKTSRATRIVKSPNSKFRVARLSSLSRSTRRAEIRNSRKRVAQLGYTELWELYCFRMYSPADLLRGENPMN